MSEENPAPDGESRAKTPFDNPLFLPAMLWIFTAWFAWDAWIVPMVDHLTFNRVGFFVALVLALWFTRRGLQERREEQARAEREVGSGS